MLFTDFPLACHEALQEYMCSIHFEITTGFGYTTENVTLYQSQVKPQEIDPFQNDVGIDWHCFNTI